MNKIKLLTIISVLFFVSCQKVLTSKEKEMYTQKGQEIAKATFNKMGGEVTKKMKEGGVFLAAPYCNAHAPEIVKDIASEYDVVLKRTSHKLRNADYAPDERENEVIGQYLNLQEMGEPMQAFVELDVAGHPHFYAPIKVQKKCLACHGVPGETMEIKSDSIIKSLYPNDKAIGFAENDLRGIWSIQFQDKE